MAKKPTTDAPERLTLTDDPEFAATQARIDELGRQRAALAEELAELTKRVNDELERGARSPRSARVKALAEGREPPAAVDVSPDMERVQEARAMDQDLQGAIRLAHDRLDRMRRGEPARKVIASVKPEMDKRLATVGVAVKALRNALTFYHAGLREIEMENPGVSIAPYVWLNTDLKKFVFDGTNPTWADRFLAELEEKHGITIKGEK